jgi:tetratricopeptide (TPR) repeat protein
VNDLLIGLLSVLTATNQAAAASNLVERTTGVVVPVVDVNDPVEREYQKLLKSDDEAQAEADRWIREAAEFEAKGVNSLRLTLNARIDQRFATVRKAYEDFLQRHPQHVNARIAYGSFLGDIGEEHGSREQYEKVLPLATNNPAIYNNLANLYGHRGPVKKAFEYYAKAIELNPQEPVYLQNYATTVFLFRKDAREHFNIDEQQVFDKAMELYRRALALDPQNFPLATDLAQTYYGIRPMRIDDALKAWRYALGVARDEIERQGVYIHLARFQINAGNFDEARKQLSLITNSMYLELKQRIGENIDRKEKEAQSPPPPAAVKDRD